MDVPAELGPDLHALAMRQGVLARVERIGGRPMARSVRAAFRLSFAGGRVLKGRRLESPDRARQVEEAVARLDPARFPPVVARLGAALLEEWVDGETLRDPGTAHLRWAGGTLRAVHRVPAPALPGRAPDPAADLGWLVEEGALPAAAARRALERAGEPPPPAPPVLQHRDLCPENLVVTPAGDLVVVDNAAMRAGPAEEDLARTIYRWPMDAAQEACFLEAYGDARAFRARRPYWMVAALAHAARVRRTRGYADAEAPLCRLLFEIEGCTSPTATS